MQGFYKEQKKKAYHRCERITDREICDLYFEETQMRISVQKLRRWVKYPALQQLKKIEDQERRESRSLLPLTHQK